MSIVYKPNQYSQQRQREKKVNIYPVHLAMEATYRKQQGDDVKWDTDVYGSDTVICTPEDIDFLSLPYPDRQFTHAFDKKYQTYGNYKFHPATHMMAALDCWYAKCNFCSWAKKYPEVKTRPVENVIEEIDNCRRLGFREIFDDSGTFPVGQWLDDFCTKLITRNNKIVLGCNMRIIPDLDFKKMKEAGFRMVLFGVESFNQRTLDKLNKGIQVKDIWKCIVDASLAGLEPHITVMTGYEWESYQEELYTMKQVQLLLRKGYAKTAQVSLYDTEGQNKIDRGLRRMIYDVAFYPDFWVNKIKDIKKWEDFIYLIKGIKKGLKHD